MGLPPPPPPTPRVPGGTARSPEATWPPSQRSPPAPPRSPGEPVPDLLAFVPAPVRAGHRLRILGTVMVALSPPLAVFSFLAAILSANACGPFGDACDDYGKAAPEFSTFVALVFLSGVAFVAGIVLYVVGRQKGQSTHAAGAGHSPEWPEPPDPTI